MKHILKMLILGFILQFVASPAYAEKIQLEILTGELPPFFSSNSKESYLTEVLNEVAKEMGVVFNFSYMPWQRTMSNTKALKAWAAAPFIRTPEREASFKFSAPLYFERTLFFYYDPKGRSSHIRYNNLTDLKQYSVGGVRGYFYEKQLQKAGITYESVTDEKQNLMKLYSGRIDFIVMNETVGNYLIRKYIPPEDIKHFGFLDKPLKEFKASLMTAKNYPDADKLLLKFNSALKKVIESGRYDQIAHKYNIRSKVRISENHIMQ